MSTAWRKSIERKDNHFLLIIIASLFLSFQLHAQKRFSLEINAGVLQPIGKDITKTYQSHQPLTIEYFSRKKFDHPYINILPNLNYLINSNVLIGIQSGIYAHFGEEFSGYTHPLFVTVPLMASARVNVIKNRSGNIGINLAGGKNFFHTDSYPYDTKNGWIFDASVFYFFRRSIFKLGVEQQLDNGYVSYISDNSWTKGETYSYKLSRLAIKLSYGFVIKHF